MFEVNDTADKYVLKPIAQGYDKVTPGFVQQGVSNFFDNLQDLSTGLNNMLQGKFASGAGDLGRLAVNSTIGILGLWDVATPMGLEKHNEDFGQTLGTWGIGDGPYLILPVLGPSNPRDLTGLIVDSFIIDPWGHIARANDADWFTYLNIVDTRSRNIEALDDIERNQIDPYSFIRTTWRQRRANDVLNGRPAPGR